MLKRILDISSAAFALIVFSPILVIISVMIKREMGAPILFNQTRPGLNGAPFQMFKFRTMREAFDADGRPLTDEQRITRLGRFLRSSSLDELPELWNVLKGDMSLVGPRPLLMEYLPLYSAEQSRRHDVRPGVTGWAQITGRNDISWDETYALDVWYVDNRSLWLDLKIIWLTIRKVIKREGIDDAGGVGQEKFKGNRT